MLEYDYFSWTSAKKENSQRDLLCFRKGILIYAEDADDITIDGGGSNSSVYSTNSTTASTVNAICSSLVMLGIPSPSCEPYIPK